MKEQELAHLKRDLEDALEGKRFLEEEVTGLRLGRKELNIPDFLSDNKLKPTPRTMTKELVMGFLKKVLLFLRRKFEIWRSSYVWQERMKEIHHNQQPIPLLRIVILKKKFLFLNQKLKIYNELKKSGS